MLRRRSIRLRIIVLVLVPVLALVGLYVVVLNLTLGKLLTLKQEASIRQLVALPVAHVQVQLGKERTLALAYLAQPGQGDLGQLVRAERSTDSAITSYNEAVRTALNSGPVPKERQAFLAWQSALGGINVLRAGVASGNFSTHDAAQAYSELLSGGDNVLNQAIIPVLTGPLGIQAIDVLTMAKASQAMGEERDLVRADLLAHSFPPADLTLIRQLAVQRADEWRLTLPELDPNLRAILTTMIPHSAVTQITAMESLITSGQANARTVSVREWTDAQNAYENGSLKALLKCAAVLAREATSQADGLARSLILIAVLGLLAIGFAIAVGVYVGRGLINQLSDLRQSAVALSSERLPAVIARLRAGEDVEVASQVPALAPGDDEIGQVREAFNAAARTAIAAAVDEVKIRRSVNDVFRSLARRNQSLLSRQLVLLDTMERRVQDPEDLADLFRVDHLTTRMRRHAEGLLIVSGGSSGRAWREPVPLVDVMRAAVAEVEDFTRIRVTSRTSAAVAGHAVADIIHLLAELVENATLFSPANTPVRIDGDKVAKGVVVEVEDRGLGMSEGQLAAANAILANPPQFDLSGSDQLGLFIAGQLAKRHGVRVSLRESPYGGIVAVALIPRALTIDIDETGLPPAVTNISELSGRPVPQLVTASEPGALADGDESEERYLVGPEAHQRTATLASRVAGSVAGHGTEEGATTSPLRGPGTSQWPVWSAVPDEPADQRQGGIDADMAAPGQVTAVDPPGTADRHAESDAVDHDAPGHGAVDEPGPSNDVADEAGHYSQESSITVPADLVDLDGLPMRIPQANLAPQLRRPTLIVQPEPNLDPSEASPEDARNFMAALQHGWERGRTAADESGASDRVTRSPGDSPEGDTHEEERR